MATSDDSSDLSSLSSLSPAPSDDEIEVTTTNSKEGILGYFPKLKEIPPKEPSPPPRRRSPSPPHEYVLADNPDIAFIVMFRSRFSDAFPKSLPHFGPQDLERDIVQSIPGDRAELFLCAVLGLLLNRKQDIKPGHYNRALEDALSTHKSQWAASWEGKSPLSSGATFNSMDPTQRLTLLRTLVLWALSSSETVKTLITQSYKQNRHEDDLNQPRSVQPWGTDGDKRRYFLIEGQDDTAFRVYRESNPQGTNRTWWSVAGSIDELKALAEKLETKDGGPKATKFAQKITNALTRFEAGEEKRKRREYRQMQKERFKRPEPGFSMYEGRTRGKRIKYTFSDDEDISFSDSTTRRSTRNTGTTTPAETGPITTSSGRQIRAPTRLNAATGESAASSVKGGSPDFENESAPGPNGRPKRAAAATNQSSNGWSGTASATKEQAFGSDEEESEGDLGDDEEDADEHVPEESEDEDDFDEDEAMVDDDLEDSRHSLVVKLSVTPPKLQTVLAPETDGDVVSPTTAKGPSLSKVDDPKLSLVNTTGAPASPLSGADIGQAVETKPTNITQPENVEKGFPAANGAKLESPASPHSISATSLALRGSPEKLHERPKPLASGIEGRE